MDTIKQANDSFLALPANVRARFQNDPAIFVAYVDHCLETGDLKPLEEMHLAVPKKTPERPKRRNLLRPAEGGTAERALGALKRDP